ncbi:MULTISPECIES: potassium-transporting ATPase subunit KdpC [Brevibacillus]|jgi:K+-transporting ATPase ATPase C chain|uniref:potassium-transporting ATPase subunit KdpC n=1 Tax=Brevibacillus TaxID=55080 RepID=UPI000EC259F3|nr:MULTISPECIES: potassium-transporting ATPase subunit KdpC [Brevibacillus]MBU8715765.1 potassium-transporting ATPase subunit KdpC [Brevibacillus parabrevis]MDR5001654.1 potassium-transporting ATPase subunit KdpC [Brevibacillus parabrevis]MED2257932.1 potassium-transporting ATPase subunit KdpC [Brevibacillus parabrevis]NRQ56453.1 potassium-transporting ATPase subunit KdpC [Brevibacillus sp. HD1.4A]UED69557.1 potassium-transporting ATPase subunit KdpC [Brevibacillus sp. HD3.3A]
MILKNLRLSVVLLLICGLIYPLAMTGVAQVVMPAQASGSLIADANGKVVGSELIGQTFTDPQYFWGRISSIDNNAAGSGSNNYAPSNPALTERVQKDIAAFLAANPGVAQADIPADLLTNSGSGLDPHISPKAAAIQVQRVAKARNLDPAKVQALVAENTEGRSMGVFGEPRVNVLKLNLALDRLK